ncbi:MAG: hypothetical protein PHH54_04290 [Candidatus Nanoarchaeia archaeon]|nr:hypothetical protein [Candidatus Nanoarchaeia archaeon]MDD5741180.1 hypothetical protein [Candidatus Nanoarchaeia archaeon]
MAEVTKEDVLEEKICFEGDRKQVSISYDEVKFFLDNQCAEKKAVEIYNHNEGNAVVHKFLDIYHTSNCTLKLECEYIKLHGKLDVMVYGEKSLEVIGHLKALIGEGEI